MQAFWEWLTQAMTDIWGRITVLFAGIRIFDVLDVLIVAFLIYKAIQFVRDTRAVQLLNGLVLIFVLLLASRWLGMILMDTIMTQIMNVGIVAIIIIFQPEFRRALEEMGRGGLSKVGAGLRFDPGKRDEAHAEETVNAVAAAIEYFSRNKIGATLVFERDTKIGEIIKSGTLLDAALTSELIISIFFPNNPLHDGAVIVRDLRIYAAGCFLPLTQNPNLSKELGTRHRAAIGISENSDSFVVVASEETGIISTAYNGVIRRNHNMDTLKRALMTALVPEYDKPKKTWRERLGFKKGGAGK